MGMQMTRRRLLGYGAGVAATTFVSTFLPPNIRRVLAEPPPTNASFKDIKHVVMLMQENRSFDHYFGTMSGVRGFNDANAAMLDTGKSVFHQPDELSPGGYLLPFHLDTTKSNAQKLPSTNHGWKTQHESWNGGKMDNWLPAHRLADKQNGPYVMGHFTRADIPFHFALAEAFTICDAYYCSIMGPTWPNRMYWMTGTIDGDGKNGGPIVDNEKIPGGYRWKTYAERLEEAGVSWKVYQGAEADRNDFNMLCNFKAFNEADPNSGMAKRGLAICDPNQFEKDCMNDNLPMVSWLVPTPQTSEHPHHMPAAGADFVARKINAIAANPAVWAKTVFILNYDENDGLFDHVIPPTPPPGTPQEYIAGLPIGGGFRVPCIIVSPWTAGGWVCSQPFDHTSVLQFLEKFTGVQEANISDWRRKTFGDMTSAFRFDDVSTKPPVLPNTVELLVQANISAKFPPPIVPSNDQAQPVQEAGSRKHTPPAA